MDIETRLHPRIVVNWPSEIETRQGSMAGRTKDITVCGASILSRREPDLKQRFSIFLRPPGERSIRVIAEKRWSGNFTFHDRTVFGMGIRFIAISPEDQRYIATLSGEASAE